jgi:dTDP-4-dehydrorhamnose 3,5-epimerase
MTSHVKIFNGDFVSAHKEAQKILEPIFVPVKCFVDDRGWSLMNLLNNVLSPEGQINYSWNYPGVVKAWHRHHIQTDFWLCTNGHIKAGIYDAHAGTTWSFIMGEKRPGILIIPPELWHGMTAVGSEPAGVLYYVNAAYNPSSPDEDRMDYNGVQGFSWETKNG